MNKFIYALATTLVLGTTVALANPGGEGNNTGCNGQGNPNSPCEGGGGNGGAGSNSNQGQLQGQLQGQAQQQSNTNVGINTNENNSSATAGANSASVSGANSHSSSNASGGSVRNSVGISVGGPRSSSSASVGDTTASGGSATGGSARSRVGDTTASSGGNSQGIEIDNSESNTLIYEGDDYAASSAAAVFANECQSGMSGQVEEGGFSVINPDQFCQHVKAARIALQAYNWELMNGTFTCTDVEYGYVTPEGQDKVVETLQEVCYSEKAMEYLASYRHHTDEAIDLVSATEEVGLIDAFFGYLVRPTAVIAALILLI